VASANPVEFVPIRLHVPPTARMDDAQFFAFCQANKDLRIERTAQGDIEIMPPTGGLSGSRNAYITRALGNWAEAEGSGEVFDSSTGFRLADGATRSPDAAWVRRERLARLSAEEKQRFLPLAPDFVIELASRTDDLQQLEAKMKEYIDNGVRLGWLIVPEPRRVLVYEPSGPVRELREPAEISADDVLPGFIFRADRLWREPF
jgi:Uma2 family endonuclease